MAHSVPQPPHRIRRNMEHAHDQDRFFVNPIGFPNNSPQPPPHFHRLMQNAPHDKHIAFNAVVDAV